MTRRRARLVVANWKMNKAPAEAAAFLTELLGLYHELPEAVQVAIAPAFPALETARRLLAPTRILVAAQDVHTQNQGAFTGEVSAAMLRDVGASIALVGHSERRSLRGETEPDFAQKMRRLAEASIAPLYCVGETLEERDGGRTGDVLERQMEAFEPFGDSPPPGLALAYEPVWAIGTGRPATAEMAAETHGILRGLLAQRFGEAAAAETRILYGGSVTPENAAALFAEAEIDGALVGGASLTVPSLAAIVQAAA